MFMSVEMAPHLVLKVKDPSGKSGVIGDAVIFLVNEGGTKTAETLNKLVCQHFEISNEDEKKMFKTALFSHPHLLDTVKLTRNDGTIYHVSLGGAKREGMEKTPDENSSVKLKPEKLIINTKIGRFHVDVYQAAHMHTVDQFGEEAIAFFNCKSFKELAQFNRQHHFSRTMIKIDLTKMPSKL